MAPRRPAGPAEAALRFLAQRDYTRQEMAARLQAKGYTVEESAEALERLVGWGYLDDRAVAERAVEDCLRRRPRGRDLLARELAARGIAEGTVREALQAYPLSDEENTARAALTRLGVTLPVPAKDRARAWRVLVRLGFAEPTIERICGFPDP